MGPSEDHPRIRGEHAPIYTALMTQIGSSPHTRGARGRICRWSPHSGIIPAYAGSTRKTTTSASTTTDHPRIRGEHHIKSTMFLVKAGSSPHTRGARYPPLGPAILRRIIPAYAGSTIHALMAPRRLRDHPRIRGEHWSTTIVRVTAAGSSPHTRGAPQSVSQSCRVGGIIPAYAGSTSPPSQWVGRRPDHPRIRGEHTRVPETETRSPGSSPHTRGALFAAAQIHALLRIIPAYAGSTAHLHLGEIEFWDHPRIRGEHRQCAAECSSSTGSSPHTRGALAADLLHCRQAGIIPAYAGSTPHDADIALR